MKVEKNRSMYANSYLVVNRKDLNAKAHLHTCRILDEITGLSDKTISQALGMLSFEHISLKKYTVDFLETAGVGDLITFSASACFHPENMLEISIQVHNNKGSRKIPLVKAVFCYEVHQRLAA